MQTKAKVWLARAFKLTTIVLEVFVLVAKSDSNWKAFNYYLVIKRRQFSFTSLRKVVEGTEHMLTAEKFPTTCDQLSY